jgi:hypothetical protein
MRTYDTNASPQAFLNIRSVNAYHFYSLMRDKMPNRKIPGFLNFQWTTDVFEGNGWEELLGSHEAELGVSTGLSVGMNTSDNPEDPNASGGGRIRRCPQVAYTAIPREIFCRPSWLPVIGGCCPKTPHIPRYRHGELRLG